MPDFNRFAVFARKAALFPTVPRENDIAADEVRWGDALEERAAILEYDGGFTRSEAERLARIEIEALPKTSGI